MCSASFTRTSLSSPFVLDVAIVAASKSTRAVFVLKITLVGRSALPTVASIDCYWSSEERSLRAR